MKPKSMVINLGGEGEVPGVINQQGAWVIDDPNWRSAFGLSFAELVATGHVFLICPNDSLPFPDNAIDQVLTNNVPIDRVTPLGMGVQSSEIYRILKSGGTWFLDRQLHYTQP